MNAVRACSRSFDETAKVWRHECGVFEQVTEMSAPATSCPTCNRALPALSPPRNRMHRAQNDNVARDFLAKVVAPSLVLAAITLVAAAVLSCAPIDPKCCLGIPCYTDPPDAGPR